jgi:hypothetical protein
VQVNQTFQFPDIFAKVRAEEAKRLQPKDSQQQPKQQQQEEEAGQEEQLQQQQQ